MKGIRMSSLKSMVDVPASIKRFALLLAILEKEYGSERERLTKNLARYYGVTL